MTILKMYDSITKFVSLVPTDGDIYAGYDDGSYNDVASFIARFPDKPVVSIDVTGAHAAQALDVENGDATIPDVDPWLANDALHGPVFDLPIIYMSVNVARANWPTTHPNGCLLWTAHYTGTSPHICGPTTCGLLSYSADMTQWKSVTDYDESAVDSTHFIWKDPPVTTPSKPINMQNDWRFCVRCGSLVNLSFGANVCAAGGKHDTTNSGNYNLMWTA